MKKGKRQIQAALLITLSFLLLFMSSSFVTNIHAQELVQQRVRFGYWEIVPAINNILTDWKASVGTFYSVSGSVSEGTSFVDLAEIYKGAKPTNWFIDPDRNSWTQTGTKVSTYSENLVQVKSRDQILTELKGLYDPNMWPTLEGYSTDYLFQIATKTWDLSPTQTRTQMGLGPITTEIWQSAPPVGFSVGNVYMSDAFGNHWSKINNGEFKYNYTKAIDTLSYMRVIPNYQRNVTYIYREIPYSMKITFWTQGQAYFAPAVSQSYLLMDWWYQDRGWFFGTIGSGAPYYVPSKTASASFQYVPKISVEALPVTFNLDFDVIAPLWTAQATNIIKTPDGNYKALYNNTWIGFAGATITQIAGGLVDPTIPSIQNVQPIQVEGSFYGVDTATTPPPTAAPANSELFYTSPTNSQKVTPAPSQQASNTAGSYATNPQSTVSTFVNSPAFSDYERVGILGAEDANTHQFGIPQVSEGGLVSDPDIYEPYWIASAQAQESALASVENVYKTSVNGEYNASYGIYQAISGLDSGQGTISTVDYSKATAQSVDHTKIESDIVNVDRQYAEDLALSLDMPNTLHLTLGATMKPAIHSWYRNIDWTYATYRDQVWSFNNEEVKREGSQNTIEILAGMEVFNVYVTYTLTFNVIVIDRYNHDFVPGTNRYTGDGLAPWIKTLFHYNYYNESLAWQYTPLEWASAIFPPIFWILFGLFAVIFAYRGARKRQQIALEGKGELSFGKALMGALPMAIVWGFIVAFIVQIIINIFTGGFPWFFL